MRCTGSNQQRARASTNLERTYTEATESTESTESTEQILVILLMRMGEDLLGMTICARAANA